MEKGRPNFQKFPFFVRLLHYDELRKSQQQGLLVYGEEGYIFHVLVQLLELDDFSSYPLRPQPKQPLSTQKTPSAYASLKSSNLTNSSTTKAPYLSFKVGKTMPPSCFWSDK